MMTIADPEKYQRHREARTGVGEWSLAMLLFASIGAITWAIRGSAGWGGIEGTILPGMTWGLLWCYLCHRKGIDARGIPLWLGLGIALGGELGYGQYVSWIRSRFEVGDGGFPTDFGSTSVVTVYDSSGKWALKLLRFDTGEVEEVMDSPQPPAGATPLDIAPDGKGFLYSQSDQFSSDLMLVENFLSGISPPSMR